MEELLKKLKSDAKLAEAFQETVNEQLSKFKKDSGEAEIRMDYLLKLAAENFANKNNIAIQKAEPAKAHLEWLAVNFIQSTPNKLDDKILDKIQEVKTH